MRLRRSRSGAPEPKVPHFRPQSGVNDRQHHRGRSGSDVSRSEFVSQFSGLDLSATRIVAYGKHRRLRPSTHDAPVHRVAICDEGASHGSPPQKTYQGRCQKSLVCPPPTSPICPMARLRRGYGQPRPTLSRFTFNRPNQSPTPWIFRTSDECLLLNAEGGFR